MPLVETSTFTLTETSFNLFFTVISLAGVDVHHGMFSLAAAI